MGEWTIVIQGAGIHDNGVPGDADAICQRFVDELAGSQQIQHAEFTVGARRTLTGGHPARKVPGG
jgi:hypothetical protein